MAGRPLNRLQGFLMLNGKSSLTIVHTESSLGWGGQERRILRELELMHSRRHRVFLIAPERSEIFKQASRRMLPAVPGRFERKHFIQEVLQLRAIFKKLGPDIVATHSSRDGWVAGLAAKLAGIRAVLKYRHVSVPVRRGPLNRWQYRTLHSMVVATSREIVSRVGEAFSFPQGRLVVIPTGVDLAKFKPGAPAYDLRGELGLPASARLIGVVSVLRSWKGHEHLIRAMQQLLVEFSDLYLVIVGEGGQRANLEDLILRLGLEQRVFLIGERDHVPGILRSLDALVLPSVQKEGIPQIILQAFASGTPVVGTEIGGVREVLTPDRGWIVPPADPGALAAAIREVLRRPELASERARAALDYVTREHSEARMIEQTLEAYGRLIKDHENTPHP